jgi:hypothetical protein
VRTGIVDGRHPPTATGRSDRRKGERGGLRGPDHKLLTDLSTKLRRDVAPGQVDQVCRREDLADLVAAGTPLGPEQDAARLGMRRVEFDWMARLGWIRSPQSVEVRFGTSRARGHRYHGR